jgi:membrane AbrB-like protein
VNFLVTLSVGVIGGWVAYWAGVPAGALVGSLVAVGLLRLMGGPVRELPVSVRRGAQAIIGTMLGASFGWHELPLSSVLLPGLALTVMLFALSAIVAWIVVRYMGWSWTAALLSTAPAGMTEISLSADAMGLDAPVVATLHLIRITTVVTLVPWLVRWLP